VEILKKTPIDESHFELFNHIHHKLRKNLKDTNTVGKVQYFNMVEEEQVGKPVKLRVKDFGEVAFTYEKM